MKIAQHFGHTEYNSMARVFKSYISRGFIVILQIKKAALHIILGRFYTISRKFSYIASST